MDELLPIIFNSLPTHIEHVVVVILGIIYIASEFCNQTTTPAPNTLWGKIYRGIEFIARVGVKAKEEGVQIPDAKQIVADLEGKTK